MRTQRGRYYRSAPFGGVMRDFVEATGLPSTDDIAVPLLDEAGRIRFTEIGPHTDARARSLCSAIEDMRR